MELGMIGLGRMGGNMAQRLVAGGHRVGTFDRDPETVTASHGFGWDCLRLLAAALANGSGLDEQVAYLESDGPISGATGILRFDASDHNGHRHDNPTTIARLADGRFVPASKLAR